MPILLESTAITASVPPVKGTEDVGAVVEVVDVTGSELLEEVISTMVVVLEILLVKTLEVELSEGLKVLAVTTSVASTVSYTVV